MRVAAEPAVATVRSIALVALRVVMALKSPSIVCGLESRNKVKPALTAEGTPRF
jgi:hypothetical protein